MQPTSHLGFGQALQELSTNDSVGSPLAGSATFDGNVWDSGLMPSAGSAGSAFAPFFRAIASSNVAGTLNVQESPDGVHWWTVYTASIAASFTAATNSGDIAVTMRYVRAQIVNGGSAQTNVELDTALVSHP